MGAETNTTTNLLSTDYLKSIMSPKKEASLADVSSKLANAGLSTDISSLTSDQLVSAGLTESELDLVSKTRNFNAETPWYKDSAMLGNVAGLGATFAQLAALPTQLKTAKLQNKALQQNIDTAKQEQTRRNKNISAFNAYRG